MFRKLLLVCLLFATVISSYGQVGNIMASYGIGGMQSIKVPGEYKFDFNSLKSFSVGYDFCRWNAAQVIELSYTKANLNEYERDEDGIILLSPEAIEKQISEFSAYVLYGKLFRNGRRIGFPLYTGVGFDYISGAPFNHLFLSATARINMKFYLLRNLGLVVGINAKAGMSSYSYPDPKDQSEDAVDQIKFMFHYAVYPQVGLIFSIH